ncbi:hypothetical protein BC831DRAFT_515897 [Entophlyctis helioformis]|nr:hypothetical protein BC831DRAFT_515897 [Entophlyctis helioformis]
MRRVMRKQPAAGQSQINPSQVHQVAKSPMIPSPFSLSLALVAALAGQTLAQGAANKAAGAAAPPVVAGANADSSGLPSGVTSFKPQDPSPFCRQFKDVPAGNGTQLKTGGRSCSSTPMG